DAAMILKVSGHVIISFPEVPIPCHWENFIASGQSEGRWTFDSVSRSRRHRGVGRSKRPRRRLLFRRRQRSYPDSRRDSVGKWDLHEILGQSWSVRRGAAKSLEGTVDPATQWSNA